WKIDGIAAEERELTEAHDGDHPKDVGETLQKPERESSAEQGQCKKDSKGELATGMVRYPAKGIDPEKSSTVLNERNNSNPERKLATDNTGRQPLLFQ